ncbi:MAG: DUF2161 domain-containing phosphodiesterase [Turneriella sp.]
MSHRRAAKPPEPSEADLYPIAARYFESRGFAVKGEVCGCDLVAVKDDTIIVAELKKTFNIKLLYQSVRRLAITDQVYAVIPKPRGRQKMSFWQMIKSLARRLNIGLLVIDGDKVMVIAEPGDFTSRVLARHRNKVLKEFYGRRVSENTGGVTGVKLQTAYLESAIHISVLLKKHKAMQPAELVQVGAAPNARQILYHNHYGWFEKSARGLYKLKAGKARVIARENPTIWQYYEELVERSN